MDKYFRAVGFSGLQAGKQLDTLIRISFDTCESKYATGLDPDDISLDCFKYFGKGIGLGLSGKMNKNKSVVLQKYFPFAESNYHINAANAEMENVENDHLIMFFDKKTYNQFVAKLQKHPSLPKKIKKVSVTALSAKGKILLPLAKDTPRAFTNKQDAKKTMALLRKINAGDMRAKKRLDDCFDEAFESLRSRMRKDDFFSIVESYFQPNDESEFSYDILADIIGVETVTNSMTDEKLYSMALDVTGTKIQAYINHNDLSGMPMPGMRFWGVCALNGTVIDN